MKRLTPRPSVRPKLGQKRDFWHIAPMDALLLHRKLTGLFLLAARLRSEVNVRELV